MGWSATSAANAYLDTLKLCKHESERKKEDREPQQPNSSEFISALAAGMSAQLMVEVSSAEASDSTIALAAAARQTGGKLVCILPEPDTLDASEEVIKESGLEDMVQFEVGDPHKLLPKYHNIDFSLVDCKESANAGLLNLLDVNPTQSVVVVANNPSPAKDGFPAAGDLKLSQDSEVRTINTIGKGVEVTMISNGDAFGMKQRRGSSASRSRRKAAAAAAAARSKSKWVTKVDERGEEHIFRVAPNDLADLTQIK